MTFCYFPTVLYSLILAECDGKVINEIVTINMAENELIKALYFSGNSIYDFGGSLLNKTLGCSCVVILGGLQNTIRLQAMFAFAGLAIFSSSGMAGSVITEMELGSRDFPGIFLKEETLNIRQSCPQSVSVSYVVEGMGEFSYGQYEGRPQQLKVKYIPPTYKKSIKWFSLCGKKKTELGKFRYTHPFPKLNRKNVEWTGNSSAPFFMSNEAYSDKKNRLRYFPVAWNKWGETVWALIDLQSTSHDGYGYSVMMNEVEPGEWVFLRRKTESAFVRLKLTGQILQKFSFRDLHLPVNSHEFLFRPESQELIYYGLNCLPAEKPKSPSHLESSLLSYDIKTGKKNQIWQSSNSFSYKTMRSLFISPFGGVDRFFGVKIPQKIEALLTDPLEWYDWPNKKCDIDWTHENSIDYRKDRGYLISVRNLNKLVLVSPDNGKALRIGAKPGCDLCIKEKESFSMQHSAHFLDANHILLFDNNTQYRGWVGRRDRNRLMLLKLSGEGNRLNKVEVEKVIDLEGVQAAIRGSVSVLPNGNWVAYMPGNTGTVVAFIEVNPKTGKKIFEIQLPSSIQGRAIESKPFFSLSGEKYIPIAAPAEEAKPMDGQFLLEYSY